VIGLSRIFINDRRILVTDHAQQRYAERIKGITDTTHDDRRRFLEDFTHLVEYHGHISYDQPDWVGVHPDDLDATKRADWYILVGADICIPVERNVALTVLTRAVSAAQIATGDVESGQQVAKQDG
jgi:hypothetical protein